MNLMNSCLFIIETLYNLDALGRWSNIQGEFLKHKDETKLTAPMCAFMNDIKKAALETSKSLV